MREFGPSLNLMEEQKNFLRDYEAVSEFMKAKEQFMREFGPSLNLMEKQKQKMREYESSFNDLTKPETDPKPETKTGLTPPTDS